MLSPPHGTGASKQETGSLLLLSVIILTACSVSGVANATFIETFGQNKADLDQSIKFGLQGAKWQVKGVSATQNQLLPLERACSDSGQEVARTNNCTPLQWAKC